ncbi:hypothetical protein JX265_013377 [Neoarthrinium moseri]|uniref:Cytochrome P450 n=1 Tax=Neoarthrinium moseri TaxID=1658444 RepID=A0A9P9W8M8_9PEZI|nr:hypothetical protein JX265_013377 [Neoarthrinium moseri]
MLLVNTIEAHRQVLQTCCYDFQKPGFFARLVGEIAGAGLLFAEADDHKRQRRFVQNVFTPPNLRKLFPVFQCKAKELTTYLSSFLERSGEHEIEVQSVFTKATLDIIGVTTLGVELENLRTPDVKLDFLSCYNRMMEQSQWSALISFINVQVPIRRWVPLEANWGFVRASNAVREILKECIRERMQAMLKHHDLGQRETVPRDLLSYLIGERISSKSELSNEQILGHLMNFLSAGHETTAGAMTWAVYVLATNQEIQDHLYAEIRELRSNNPAQDYTTVDRLPYLHNFVRELLRLYSPAVFTNREATRNVIICGFHIPKGTKLVLSPYVTNLSPRVWGPDSHEFHPKRWDNLSGEAAGPYGIETFSNGPRICIGKQYAIMEIKTLLVELVSHFVVTKGKALASLENEAVPLHNPAVTLRPRDGLRVKFHPRQ